MGVLRSGPTALTGRHGWGKAPVRPGTGQGAVAAEARPVAGGGRRRAVGPQEAVAERVHRPLHAVRRRLQPRRPAPAVDPPQDARVVGDQGDRHVVGDAGAADQGVGLVVAEHHHHQVGVVGVPDEGHQGGQRVADRPRIAALLEVGVAEDPERGLVRALEPVDRAVTDLVPRDQVRHLGPGVVAGVEVDLGHHRAPVLRGQDLSVERGQGVLVGHTGIAVARTDVADVARVEHPLVAVEGLALRPGARVGRDVVDGLPAGPSEGAGQGEPVTAEDPVVAPLVVDPQAALQGGVCQPADPAEGRGAQPRAAGVEAESPSSPSSLVSRRWVGGANQVFCTATCP